MEDTCFGFISLPEDLAGCREVAEALLAEPLVQRLPSIRRQRLREDLDGWEALTLPQREELRATLGWRRAMFVDDAWLHERLEGEPPGDRVDFAAWAGRQLGPLRQVSRDNRQLPVLSDRDSTLDWAERILTRDLSPIDQAGYWAHGEAIDWHPRPEDGIDNEVIIRALRLHPLAILAAAWVFSHDSRYSEGIIDYLADITWERPGTLVQRVGVGGCRTHWGLDALDVASRTGALLEVYGRAADVLDPAAMLIWKTFYFCGARAYEYHHSSCHNIVFFEPTALGRLGFLLSAFTAADSWRTAAQERLTGALYGSLLPDGSNVEGQFSYHGAYVVSPYTLMEAADEADLPLQPGLIEAYNQQATRGFEFWAKLATPDRQVPAMGDCWPMDIGEHLRVFGARLDCNLAGQVGSGGGPTETCFYLPDRRLAVMRSDWSAEAAWSCVDLRGWHGGHDHYHLLQVLLQQGGQPLLIDSGCIDYCANRPRSQATCAHNTLEVDGDNHAPGGAVDIHWHRGPGFAWVEGLSLAYAGVHHRRAVCFLEPDTLVVLDRVSLMDGRSRSCRFHWHVAPDLPVAWRTNGLLLGDRLALQADLADGMSWGRRQGFQATTYLRHRPAPVAVAEGEMSRSFGMATVMQLRDSQPVFTVSPVIWRNAGSGDALPRHQALGLEMVDPAVTLLWSDRGFGEKTIGATSTDGNLLIAVGDQVHARGATRVTRHGASIPWQAL